SALITALAFSPDGTRLASAGVGWRVRLWDMPAGKQRTLFQGNSTILSLAFQPGGKLLAYGSTAGNFAAFDLAFDKPSVALNTDTTAAAAETGGRLYVAFSPDGKTLATGSADRKLRLWNVDTGRVITTLPGHTKAITCVAFSPTGKI